MRVVKAFRGISKRLAIHYLKGLGGRPVDAAGREVEGAAETTDAADRVDRVESEHWTVHLSTSTVSVGPTIELTELETVFEGDAAAVEPLVEDFTWKAMRAGG